MLGIRGLRTMLVQHFDWLYLWFYLVLFMRKYVDKNHIIFLLLLLLLNKQTPSSFIAYAKFLQRFRFKTSAFSSSQAVRLAAVSSMTTAPHTLTLGDLCVGFLRASLMHQTNICLGLANLHEAIHSITYNWCLNCLPSRISNMNICRLAQPVYRTEANSIFNCKVLRHSLSKKNFWHTTPMHQNNPAFFFLCTPYLQMLFSPVSIYSA